MEKTIFRGYVSLLIFAPLAFGTTELWSLTLLETGIFALTLLFLIHQWLREKKIYHTPGLLPLLLFLSYVFFQIIPLPPWVLQLLSPEIWGNYQNTIAVTNPSSWFSLSINKKATIGELYRYGAYFCFYFLTVQILTSHKKLDLTVNALLTFAPILSTFAIIQYYTSKDTIYWIREVPVNSIIFGPYVNHNHFAGLIEMILPIAVAMFLCLKPRVSYVMTWREKILDLFDLQGFNSYILVGFSAILLAVAIVLSLSRGAIISVGLALLIFTILLVISGRYRQKGWVFGVFILLFILSVQWFGWNTVFERFDRLENDRAEIYETRFDIWKDSSLIAKDLFITGAGFGSFKTIYPRYRTFGGEKSVLHAHNDYLELLIEGGIISVLFVCWFLFQLFSESYRVYSHRHERYSIYLFLGSLTGIISILLHSFTDFNLHIGANGLFFFFLCGLLVSAANTRSRSPKQITYLRQFNYPFRLRVSTCSLTAILLISCLVLNSGTMIGELHFASIKDIYLSSKIPPGKLKEINEVADSASFFDPLEGRYYYAIGNLKTLLHGFPASLKSFKKAVHASPYNGEYLQKYGLALASSNRKKEGDALLRAGMQTDILNPEGYRTYAYWLLSQNQNEKSIPYLRKALSLEQSKTAQYITHMLVNGFEEEDILSILPHRVKALHGFADYLRITGNTKKAEEIYLLGLSYMVNEERLKPEHFDYFLNVYNFYQIARRYSDALNIITQAIEFFPNTATIRVLKAKSYQKMGITYRAIEEYQMALTLDPENKDAIEALRKLQ